MGSFRRKLKYKKDKERDDFDDDNDNDVVFNEKYDGFNDVDEFYYYFFIYYIFLFLRYWKRNLKIINNDNVRKVKFSVNGKLQQVIFCAIPKSVVFIV
jgi:hypothetical protein